MNDNDIKKFIYNELSKFNFKRETKGFKYLCDAIFICIKDENALDNLSKNVFPQIAKKYNDKNFEYVLKDMKIKKFVYKNSLAIGMILMIISILYLHLNKWYSTSKQN